MLFLLSIVVGLILAGAVYVLFFAPISRVTGIAKAEQDVAAVAQDAKAAVAQDAKAAVAQVI